MIKGLSLEKPYKIIIKDYNLLEIKEDEVKIKTVYAGICGSDIAYFEGKEKYLGDDMFGHEGVGIVIEVGRKVKKFKVGDYVSSYWHPAFREYYNVPEYTCIRIPELSPKYILQCVSCVVNALIQVKKILGKKKNPVVLLVGSGFTAYTFAQVLDTEFDVLGKHNKVYFKSLCKNFFTDKNEISKEYDVIINCSTGIEVYEIMEKNIRVCGIFVNFSTPRIPYTTQFENWNWKNILVLYPSPRAETFRLAMEEALRLIEKKKIDMNKLYSKGYSFIKSQEAFLDFVYKRKEGEFKYYLEL